MERNRDARRSSSRAERLSAAAFLALAALSGCARGEGADPEAKRQGGEARDAELGALAAAAIPPPLPAMALVKAGPFLMGSEEGEADERPVHAVELTRDILVAERKVTEEEYGRFCGETGRPRPRSRFGGGPGLPAIGADFYDAVAYCDWLSLRHGLSPCYSGEGAATACDFDASGYRLPTEAEWEWAARGGRLSKGFRYAGSDDPLAVAWFDENSGGAMRPCGTLAPNELGLYDMSGNLYEWCWDYYARDYYALSPAVDPEGPPPGSPATPRGPEHARRAGSWREGRGSIRVAFRSLDNAGYPGDNGFRLVRTAGK